MNIYKLSITGQYTNYNSMIKQIYAYTLEIFQLLYDFLSIFSKFVHFISQPHFMLTKIIQFGHFNLSYHIQITMISKIKFYSTSVKCKTIASIFIWVNLSTYSSWIRFVHVVHLQKAKQCKCYQITASDDILNISKQWTVQYILKKIMPYKSNEKYIYLWFSHISFFFKIKCSI